MAKFVVRGGKKLNGRIKVAGNKNAVLPIMAATLLLEGETVLSNVPEIKDVAVMAEILEQLGATVKFEKADTVIINTDKVNRYEISADLATRLRASVLLLGPLLVRFGKARLPFPGGDIIGRRDIDTHLQAFTALGARVKITQSDYQLELKKAVCCRTFLREPSVTGTENLIMAALLSQGETVLENVAAEPHIVDFIHFLNKSGAKISGAGTSQLTIVGVKKLQGIKHRLVPDHIEVGTFAVAAALCGGKVDIYPVRREHVMKVLLTLEEFRVRYKLTGETLTVEGSVLQAPKSKVQAMPWPGLPTDLMSPLIILATQSRGETLFHDPLYESRMFFVDKLIRMGAQVTICDPHRVIVHGPTKLFARHLASPDIRAGMTLVIAALIAVGTSTIENAEIVERGYENVAERLTALGADIKRTA